VDDNYQDLIISDFNNYAKEQHLDITIHRTTLSSQNSSIHVDDYATFIESKLNKKNPDYDIIFIDIIYAYKYVNHVADLNKYLSKETLDNYKSGIASKIGYIGNKWVTMVNFYIYYIYITFCKRILYKYNS